LRAEGETLRGYPDEAVKEFQAALQRHADEPELHEALGELYLNQRGDDAAAQSELEKALALDPARTRSLYLLGRLFVQNKDNEKALPYLQRALRLRPDFMEANSLLGTVYVRTGQFAEAIPKLLNAAPSDHYGNVHYQLYIAYRKLGKIELAKKELALSQQLRRSYLEHDEAVIMGSPQPEPDSQ
jgi:tetratricopeptide (TPR) repeat protein